MRKLALKLNFEQKNLQPLNVLSCWNEYFWFFLSKIAIFPDNCRISKRILCLFAYSVVLDAGILVLLMILFEIMWILCFSSIKSWIISWKLNDLPSDFNRNSRKILVYLMLLTSMATKLLQRLGNRRTNYFLCSENGSSIKRRGTSKAITNIYINSL